MNLGATIIVVIIAILVIILALIVLGMGKDIMDMFRKQERDDTDNK